MGTVAFYLLVVIAIAFPLALFEIWLERFKTGWGGSFRPGSFLGKKLQLGIANKVAGDDLVTPYHLITFFLVVPLLYCAALYSLSLVVAHGRIIWPIFLVACQLGIMMLEDALWFVLNTVFRMRFPDALPRLLRGDASWHPRWIQFGFVNRGTRRFFSLPDFYLAIPLAVVLLLCLQAWIVR